MTNYQIEWVLVENNYPTKNERIRMAFRYPFISRRCANKECKKLFTNIHKHVKLCIECDDTHGGMHEA